MVQKLLERVARSNRPCLILDGGMGTSLNRLDLDENDVWSAPRRLDEQHIRNAVKQVHLQFLACGADILTTNTYDMYYKGDFYQSRESNIEKWTKECIDVANEAISEYCDSKNEVDLKPLLALSIGSFATTIPMRAETANREEEGGEEYSRVEGYGLHTDLIRSYFDIRCSDAILSSAASKGVAIIAFETIGDKVEIQVICEFLANKADLLKSTGLSTWLTLTCLDEEHVDTGASVASCVEIIARCPYVTGVGINCTEPRFIKPLICTIKQVLKENDTHDKLIVVYPNSGELYLSRELKEGESEHWKKVEGYETWTFEEAAVGWIEDGADIVGGCCRITNHDISKFVAKLGRARTTFRPSKTVEKENCWGLFTILVCKRW